MDDNGDFFRIPRYKALAIFSFLLLLILFFNYSDPPLLTWDVSVRQLTENMDYFEGKDVIVKRRLIKETGKDEVFIWDFDKSSSIRVLIPRGSLGRCRSCKVITLGGISYLRSERYIEAEWIHLHKRYFWRMYFSPLALFVVFFYLHKEKVI